MGTSLSSNLITDLKNQLRETNFMNAINSQLKKRDINNDVKSLLFSFKKQ